MNCWRNCCGQPCRHRRVIMRLAFVVVRERELPGGMECAPNAALLAVSAAVVVCGDLEELVPDWVLIVQRHKMLLVYPVG